MLCLRITPQAKLMPEKLFIFIFHEYLLRKQLCANHLSILCTKCQAVLEQYLKSLCSAQLKEKGDVCEFFNSNIVINERSSPSNRPGFMQGYLTKKGRNFGGWQTRYYVLNGPVLEYFDSRGGTKLGFLGITGAQIGRQQQQRMHKEKEGKVDHILCAETDEERDAWVEALTCYVSGCFVSAEGTMSTSKSSNQTPTGITSSPASNGRSRRQTSLDSFNRSETSLFNPHTNLPRLN
ncbi:hypothetical protein PPACK8108_LOCUS13061 [Phakopsora pachyrhizi]|uniref:PH domain-containing protein n=1 Tax=Phakopsora pachyrhizi TaxID=170000 RepID=A0AAV0B4Y7_PHAPC|nr:hypothetical protein PPACK8108_LOCUS13061 [Phakopsora pachyrhizi]